MLKHALWRILFITFLSCSIYSQWAVVSQLNVNELGGFPSISAPNSSVVVVAGGNTNNPRVFRSTNGGINFSNITGNISGVELYCVWALNADTIFVGDGGSPGGTGGNAKVYKTTNGGVNWTIILTTGGNSGFISGIVFQRPQQSFGIIVSDSPVANTPYWVAKTFDGGNTWNVTTPPYTPQYSTQNSVFVVDSSFYGFGIITSPAKIYLTTSAGANWSLIPIGLNGNSVPSISFKSDKLTGIAVSDVALPNIARTTNTGVNWQAVNLGSGTTGVGTVKWVPGTDIFFFAANKIKRSSNGGISWFDMDTQGILNFAHFDLISTGSNSICSYALASDGKILKYEGEPFGIDPNNTNVPSEFILKQNYPNPFNPATTIKYSLPKSGYVSLKIHDAKGSEIRTVINSYQRTGNYIETIDLSDFASGIYFYTLQAGEFTQTRKMVLIK